MVLNSSNTQYGMQSPNEGFDGRPAPGFGDGRIFLNSSGDILGVDGPIFDTTDEELGSLSDLIGTDVEAEIIDELFESGADALRFKTFQSITLSAGDVSPVDLGIIAFEDAAIGFVISSIGAGAGAPLDSIHRAAHELVKLDSPSEILDNAIEIAEESLTLSQIAFYRYNDEERTLELAATNMRETVLDSKIEQKASMEDLLWRCFIKGRGTLYQHPDLPTNTEFIDKSPAIRSLMVLPVGDFGVFCGATEDSNEVSRREYTLAEILMSTISTAIEQVSKGDKLEQTRTELERRNEELRKSNDLHRISNAIHQGLAVRPNDPKIHEQVCRHVTSVERFPIAWYGAISESKEQLELVAAAGQPSLTPPIGTMDAEDGDGITDLTNQVLITNSAAVLTNLESRQTEPELREFAFRAGIQSILAVPVAQESHLRGVLFVGGRDSETFDQTSQDQFTNVASTIGNSLTLTDQQSGLLATGGTEVKVEMTDEELFFVKLTALLDCKLELLDLQADGKSVSLYVTLPGVSVQAVESVAGELEQVHSIEPVSHLMESDVYCIKPLGPKPSLITDYGGQLVDITADSGRGEVTAIFPRTVSVRAILSSIREQYPKTDLIARVERDSMYGSQTPKADVQSELTNRQREVLTTAFEFGYFDWPRTHSGEEIAEKLGISQPTFNQHLRFGTKALMNSLFNREDVA